MERELRQLALHALCTADPQEKATLARALYARASTLTIAQHAPAANGATLPGRPLRPELIHPAKVPRRSPFNPEGLAALLHAIAHIEFNAINLALDAAWRFDGMPPDFHHDWLRVASEEALHFTLLREHLATLGHAYGDFPAHDNLWSMCERTAGDVIARMALVPRTLEARGLDASPLIQRKLRQVGTPAALRAVEILDIILADEVGHVAIGNHWYRWLCGHEGLDPVAHYGVLVERHDAPKLHPPFNEAARKQAGFTDAELAMLTGQAS
ncbi:ferritin-like domain-containing protein [uncultured Ramlibacter sp.]|uniref:ferritin-like domain-containing protein n=1 Tax=uncultured Ramlibacter sp. TaxID=260755 RepID=UPI0026374C35|nr:ferritin-like domain-containing protein [uncultured Ramlibacter sp.]